MVIVSRRWVFLALPISSVTAVLFNGLFGSFLFAKVGSFFFSDKLAALLIFLLCVGTNYLQIVPANASPTGVYLFIVYAALLYLIHLWHKKPKFNYSFLIVLLSALMILSRPNELLFLLVPVSWIGGEFNTYRQKLLFFWNNKRHIVAV